MFLVSRIKMWLCEMVKNFGPLLHPTVTVSSTGRPAFIFLPRLLYVFEINPFFFWYFLNDEQKNIYLCLKNYPFFCCDNSVSNESFNTIDNLNIFVKTLPFLLGQQCFQRTNQCRFGKKSFIEYQTNSSMLDNGSVVNLVSKEWYTNLSLNSIDQSCLILHQ